MYATPSTHKRGLMGGAANLRLQPEGERPTLGISISVCMATYPGYKIAYISMEAVILIL